MLSTQPPTDQRAGVRPISFVLDNAGSIGSPVNLVIRPEDLTRTEPSRATVHQTLGREVSGWVDHFGEGLPSVTLAGHTGWRYKNGSGMDGAASFDALNSLLVHQYPAARQAAINSGRDPSAVQLLFVDMLDDFAWSVVPMQFVLRRSKSRPLLYQYNMTLQAVRTDVDTPVISLPFFGSVPAGLGALNSVVSAIDGLAGTIGGLAGRALGAVGSVLGPISASLKNFVSFSARLFRSVSGAISAGMSLVTGISNQLVGIARDVAQAGVNVFRTISAIRDIPTLIKAEVMRVASAFNEVLCLLSNSLRPRKKYEDYSDLYGASNCSSTTGGRPASPYENQNVFSLARPADTQASPTSAAVSSLGALQRTDPVTSPMPLPEIGRHVDNIVAGVSA